MRRSGLALALLAIVAAPVFAADGFHGRVLDSSGKPLSGAIVSATNREIARTTSVYADADGRFAMPDIAAGAYDLRARHFGYRDGMKMDAQAKEGEVVFRLET